MRFTSTTLLVAILGILVVPSLCVPTGLITVERANGRTSGKHIVTLKKGINKADLISQLKTFNVTHKWDIINGFASHCDDSTLDYLRAHSDVESIAEDSVSTLSTIISQVHAPWGLARMSQSNSLGATADPTALTYSYTFDSSAGKGVDIYIIDTGIYTAHISFQGRARWGTTFGGYPDVDGQGHGTHCAGTAASLHFGVAKAANLIAVKVFGNDGHADNTDVVSGLDWVKSQAATSRRPSVASLSFLSHPLTSLDDAVDSLIKSGVHVVVGAGNNGLDASNFSPCNVPSIVTVGASDIADNVPSWSNRGESIKIIAPGVTVVGAYVGSPTAFKFLTGTSMAAPYVAGLMAYYIALNGDNMSPEDLIIMLQKHAVPNALHGVPKGTVNLLAQNMY